MAERGPRVLDPQSTEQVPAVDTRDWPAAVVGGVVLWVGIRAVVAVISLLAVRFGAAGPAPNRTASSEITATTARIPTHSTTPPTTAAGQSRVSTAGTCSV